MRTKVTCFVIFLFIQHNVFGQAASSNYDVQTGTLGSTYNWIDCSAGTSIITGDDAQATISWPFDFSFYDNTYTTSNSLSIATNGFIRLDGNASTNYTSAQNYTLSSTSTELGQIIALAVYDGNISDAGSWVNYLVTGVSPDRILTIEYNNLEIDYNDGRYTDVQVSFYETSDKIIIKLGDDNINKSGADIGIHSGVNTFYNKWQEVRSGTNNTWIEYTRTSPPVASGPAASWNYLIETGSTGSTYSWIDCSSGTTIVNGDDAQASISWPFDFDFYDNSYTTDNTLSVSTNGFIRLDNTATTDYSVATSYDLTSTATNLGQIIAMAVYDGNVTGTGWVRSLVTGSAPNQVFTIEYNNLEIDYNDNKFTDAQVSFYQSSNKIVLKLGADNITKSGADMGIHSGVGTFFDKWQEVRSGTNNTWIEYTPKYIEVNATIGTSPSYYPTLKAAFDKINDGTHQGDITLKIQHSTTETSSAVLNASGSGSANFNSVYIYPTITNLSINGNLSSPLIDLNGADNVTIDGRVNATGTDVDLSVLNSSTASVAGTSTLRFRNGATNNTVKYCTIKGSETRAGSGVIFFSTTNTGSGNNNNIIDNNNITSFVDANRPVQAIYSRGTLGKENSGNIISNNNIYDFLKHATASSGINLAANTTDWTIDGNSFYETTSFTPTGTVTFNIIRISNTSGNSFVISNNFFGGSETQCGGTAWTKVNSTNNVFNAIYLNVDTTSASSIQNNTIQNINWSNSAIANWAGININKGSVDIGTTAGNIIGDSTGTGSISVTGGTNGQRIYGIKINSIGEINCNNNSIGSITGLTASTFSTHIYGIDLSGSCIANIANNTIGSISTGASINASSASTANVQKVYGIYTDNTGTTTLFENVISNLKNNTSNTAVGTKGLINGIYISDGTNVVYENTIHDISIANANTSAGTPSAAGLFLNAGTDVQSIHTNLIYNISNTYALFTGSVMGVYSKNSLGASAGYVNANFIHSLSVNGSSTGAKIYGIYENTDSLTYANNIISLGGNSSTEIYGIYDVGNTDKNVDFFFNTIYLSGTNAGSENSYAIRYNTNQNNRDLRNNILFNSRTGGTGNHYAIYYDATAGTFTADYNDYLSTGTGGVIAYYSGNASTLALLQTATSQDVSSLNTDPVFTTAGGTNSTDYITSGTLPGVAGTGITTDYEEITRNSPPKMGALESSLSFVWQGNTSTNFATASNWENGVVPTDGTDIEFATTPTNDCYLDQNRTLKNITNTSTKKFIVNGNQLIIKGNIVSATANQIDATSSSSAITFAGTAAQNIPSGVFVSNTIDGLTLNNDHGLTQNGDLIVQSLLTLTDGNFSIGANTLTINGAVSTTSGSLSGGSTSNMNIGGSGASTTLPSVALNNLTLNRANGVSLGGALSIEGTLTLTSGTLNVGANTLTISGTTPTRTSGNIDASNASSTAIFSNSSAITLTEFLFTGNINNLTISGAGITASEDLSIDGILNLQSANQSAIKGCLDMATFTLNMGASATTIGIGDVTGKIKRTTILPNVEYTFGNQYSSVTFPNIGTLPTEITLKVEIGTTPSWKSDGIERIYDISQVGGSGTRAVIKSHYLDSELNGLDELGLSFFSYIFPSTTLLDRGLTELNTTENWITLSNADFGNLTSSFGVIEHGFGVSTSDIIIWDGSESTDWYDQYNWTPAIAPTASKHVIIPDSASTANSPLIAASSGDTIKTLVIQAGGVLNAGASSQLTIVGSGGAWHNDGDFNASTSNVIFNHGVVSEIVTIAGITNFYNIEVGPNTTFQPVPGNYLSIGGVGMADATSLVDFSTINNTVEWNGADQTIVNPIGIAGNSGYYNLILSGSGTKTMPTSSMTINDEFVLEGSVIATAQSALTIGGELEILNGATFATGAFDHIVGGHFDVGGHSDVGGIFIPTLGTTITLNGSSMQKIYGASAISFENLVIDNSAGVDLFTDIVVNDALTLTNGNLNTEATTLTLNGGLTKASGFLNVNSLSSLTFGGTTALTLPSSLFYTSPGINDLTINRTGGVEFSSNITITDTLDLQSANPLSTKGALDMGTYTLSMGENATTIGIGDVTGIVKREHTFTPNTDYSFGSQYTTINFIDNELPPSWISVKISIGTVPTWTPWTPSPDGKVKRLYQFACSDNSSIAQTNINMRYLVSELDPSYNDEDKLIIWHKSASYGGGAPHEHGKSAKDLTNHTIGLTGLIFGTWASANLDESKMAIAYSITAKNTWKGEVVGHETEWEQSQNWTAGNVPLSTDEVFIPGGLTYYPSLTASANAVVKNIEIESGASITANSYTITVSGSGGAWINNGTFNAGTGKVLFNHGVSSEIVTVAGTTNFYNIEVGANTTIRPVSGSILRISGAVTADITSLIDFTTINSTVEWNGANQTIVNPIGIGDNMGYYNLILSGSGTKTMPTTAMTINGDFSISGTTSVTAADSIYINGKTTISSGATFANGVETHILKGDFENNGTYIPTSGGVIMLHGTSPQTISGSSTTTFDGLCINNLNNVTLSSNVNVNNVLSILDGLLDIGANTLGMNGTIVNPSGNIEVSSLSSLSFGGTAAITLNNNLFNGNPTINNLVINRSGGVTLGNESITVNGTLTLTAGTLTLAENSLTIAGNSPVRTSGAIDVSNASATILFTNTSAITLPASLFSGNVNNMTINSSGGVSSDGDITITQNLYLQSANPSSVKGSLDMGSNTLLMGANAANTGQGDVTGIIKRTSIAINTTYTFGNPYSTIFFPNVGTLPSEISLKVTLGSSPTWKTGAINRLYELIQTGGNGTQARIQNHYLDSELNGNNENLLGEWMYIFAYPLTIDYGRSDNNINENWVKISNVNVGVFSSTFGNIEIALGEYANTNLTWNGSTSTSWVTASNWTPMGAPSDNTVITIPDAATTTNDPTIPEIAVCGEMIIESGGILNAISGAELTITGANGAWINNGTFNAGTSNIIFGNGNPDTVVTVSGTTDFYDLTVEDKTWLQPSTGSVLGIENELHYATGSILDFTTNNNTIDYNGTDQAIINPGGGSTGFYNLSLSGNGVKTLPPVSVQIIGNLSLSESASTSITNDLTVGTNLNLSNSSILTITATKTLTVNGTITNSVGVAGFILESSKSGTASLIHNTDNVPATVQRYVSGNSEDWHFISSPVSNQSISGSWTPSGTYGNGTGYDMYLWNEPNSCWIYNLNTTSTINWNTVHPGSNFEVARGYLYSVQDTTDTKEFIGNLNNGTYNVSLSYASDTLSLKGFNLIGNPYPSTIDWKAAAGWTRSDLENAGGGYNMWIWNPDANNYGVYNSADTDDNGTNSVSRYIASAQGFFVQANTAGAVSMNNSVRVADGGTNWKSSNIDVDKIGIRIKSDAGLGSDEVRLNFGYTENENGALKLFSNVLSAPSLYIPYFSEDFSIVNLTDIEENPAIPISFVPGANGNYTINCDFELNKFDVVMLEDCKTHYIQDLKAKSTYSFKADVTDNKKRFVIHFSAADGDVNSQLPARVYSNGSQLVIDLQLVSKQTSVAVYDVLGRMLVQEQLMGETLHNVDINSNTQILIVYLKNPDGSLSKKILWM